MTIGQFVLINTYLMQLYQPLNFLGIVYMTIKQGLVDMEQMFRLMAVEPEMVDKPGAPPLAPAPRAGEVRVRGRAFRLSAQSRDPAGLSASRVPAGRTLAIVGPTGAASRPSAGCCSASTT